MQRWIQGGLATWECPATCTLFQLMTLDDWFYMYSEVAERHPGAV